MAQRVKCLPAMQETWVRSLGWKENLEKGTATDSSILAWRIPWTIQSMGSQRVWHDWATFTRDFPGSSDGKASACNGEDLGSIPGLGRSPGEEKGYLLQYSGLENPMPWDWKESDTTEQLSLSLFSFTHHNATLREALLLSPLYGWGNWGS